MKIYLAGKLNADAPGYIKNMHTMIDWDLELRKQGFSVFNPCLDFLTGLVDGCMGYEDYFKNNTPWLLSADAMFVCPNWETSEGTKREIMIAQKAEIPVYYNFSDLWNNRTW